jgi:hypothetical protein
MHSSAGGKAARDISLTVDAPCIGAAVAAITHTGADCVAFTSND